MLMAAEVVGRSHEIALNDPFFLREKLLKGIGGGFEDKLHIGPMPRVGPFGGSHIVVMSHEGMDVEDAMAVAPLLQFGKQLAEAVVRIIVVVEPAELDHAHSTLPAQIFQRGPVCGWLAFRDEAFLPRFIGPSAVNHGRRWQPLDLPPRRGDVGWLHAPAGFGHEHERLVADLVDQPRHAIGGTEDRVVAGGFERLIPIEPCGLHLSPEVGDRLGMVERFQVGPRGDPLREAVHLWAAQPLLQGRSACQDDMHGRQRGGHVRQQPQLLDEPQRQRVGLVHKNHESGAGRRQAAYHFDHGNPQFSLVDPAIGLPQVGQNRLPECPAGADSRPGEQCRLEILPHALGHFRQQQRLARARRPDHQRDPFGAADGTINAVQRRINHPRGMIELDARSRHEWAGRQVPTGLMHRGHVSRGATATSN